jgi:hypothetical protein
VNCAYCGGCLTVDDKLFWIDGFIFKVIRYYKECDSCAIYRLLNAFYLAGSCLERKEKKIVINWEEYWLLEAEAEVHSPEMHLYFKNCAAILFEAIGIVSKEEGFKIFSYEVDNIAQGYFFKRKKDLNAYIKNNFVKLKNPSILIRFVKPRKTQVS